MLEIEGEESFSVSETSEASEELDDLDEEENLNEDDETADESFMEVDDESGQIINSDRSTTPTPGTAEILMATVFDFHNEDSDDEDYQPLDFGGKTVFTMSPEQLQIIRTCIKDIQLPTWVDRPPTKLGEASHGKLKVQELLMLFTVIFPLIIPELWWKTNLTGHKLLENFYDVVSTTNIISSFTTSNEEADRYMVHLVKYRKSTLELFPQFDTPPNLHFAMHNGDLLKYWGPLAVLNEFSGERLNGEFGKVKTNRCICTWFN